MNSKIAQQVENERLLEKAREAGIEIRSFDGWKQVGKWVKKGEKQKQIRVKSGVTRRMNPINGEDEYDTCWKFAYGFTKEQVR